MTPAQLDATFHELAKQLHEGHMWRLGISPTMELASLYNECKFAQQKAWRDSLYEHEFDTLLEDNGGLTRPSIELHDGWAVDTSCSLPHLDRVLEESDVMIAERRGVRLSEQGAYRSFFQDIFSTEDTSRFPSFIDFATSSDVLSVVGHYLKTVPALSTTLPSGIRVVESNAEFDDQPDHPKDSQLFHIDYYALPNVYVLVLLRDTTIDHGPWTFLPRAVSQRVRNELGYWRPGRDYRLSDAEVYSVVDPSEVIAFTYPRGTVLFIESSGCMHYGSRNAFQPRFQLMLGYTGACRTDFSEVVLPIKKYPLNDTDSLLRKLALNKYMNPPDQQAAIDMSKLPALLNRLQAAAADCGVALECCREEGRP